MSGKIFALFAGVVAVAACCGLCAAEVDPVFYLPFEEQDGATVCVDRMDAKRACRLINPKRYSFGAGKAGKALSLANAKEKTSRPRTASAERVPRRRGPRAPCQSE